MATDAENKESVGFNFGRQSDSTHKFTRIRKNLDLFVMERNERHLTSLHWNWQKLSKADEAGDSGANPDNCFAPVISSSEIPGRQIKSNGRSRQPSRHRIKEHRHSLPEPYFHHNRSSWSRHGRNAYYDYHKKGRHKNGYSDESGRQNFRGSIFGFHETDRKNDADWKHASLQQGNVPEFIKINRGPENYRTGRKSTGRGELCTPLEYHQPRAVTTDSRRSIYSIRDFAQEEGMVLEENVLTSFVSGSDRTDVQSSGLWHKDSIFTSKTKRTVLAQFIGIEERRATDEDVGSATEDKIFHHSDHVVEKLVVNSPEIVSNSESRSISPTSKLVLPMTETNSNRKRETSTSVSSDQCSTLVRDFTYRDNLTDIDAKQESNRSQVTPPSTHARVSGHDPSRTASSTISTPHKIEESERQFVGKENGIDSTTFRPKAEIASCLLEPLANVYRSQEDSNPTVIGIFSRSPSADAKDRDQPTSQNSSDDGDIVAVKQVVEDWKCGTNEPFTLSECKNISKPNNSLNNWPIGKELTNKTIASTSDVNEKSSSSLKMQPGMFANSHHPPKDTERTATNPMGVFQHESGGIANDQHAVGEAASRSEFYLSTDINRGIDSGITKNILRSRSATKLSSLAIIDPLQIEKMKLERSSTNFSYNRRTRSASNLSMDRGPREPYTNSTLVPVRIQLETNAASSEASLNLAMTDTDIKPNDLPQKSESLNSGTSGNLYMVNDADDRKCDYAVNLAQLILDTGKGSLSTGMNEVAELNPDNRSDGEDGGATMKEVNIEAEEVVFVPASSDEITTDEKCNCDGSTEVSSQQIPPGVAHEDFDMIVNGNGTRADSPYVTSSISDKIKAIKNQLSELNEEIDTKITKPDLELEADLQDEKPPLYAFSNSQVIIASPTMPEECRSDDQAATDICLRSKNGFVDLHDDLADDERSMMAINSAPVEQAWKRKEVQTYRRATSPNNDDVASSRVSDCLKKLDDEYVQGSRHYVSTEYSPKSHYATIDMTQQSPEVEVRSGRYQITSGVSLKKTTRSPEIRPELKERKHSRDYKTSDTPEILQSLPFCHQSMDSMQDSNISMTQFSDTSSEIIVKGSTATTRRKSVILDVPGIGLRIPRQNSNDESDAETGEQEQKSFFTRTIGSIKKLYKGGESKKDVIVVASSANQEYENAKSGPSVGISTLLVRVLKNTGFRRPSHRITNSAQKNDLEIFPESEKDSGCQPGYGRESASTQWRSNMSGKKSGSYGKNKGKDSAVSVSQVRHRFLDDDKNSQVNVLEDIDYDVAPIVDSPSSIPKGLILEKDDGTISEISGDFSNEKAEKDKFSNNDSSEIWTEKRAESKRSLLEGLGTSYCVLPHFIWKYIGQDTDDEPMTRKKCIAFILGAILAVLLVALLLGLIIGIATSVSPEEFSPLRFTVIPGLPAAEENLVDSAPG